MEALDPKLLAVVQPGLKLTDFATLYRYPGEPEIPSVDEARPWVEVARSIFAAVEQRVAIPAPESEPVAASDSTEEGSPEGEGSGNRET